MSPDFDPPSSPSQSSAPSSSASTSSSSSSLSLPLSLDQMALHPHDSAVPASPRDVADASFYSKLDMMPERIDEDAVMMDWDEDNASDESSGPPRPDYSKRHDVPPRLPRPYSRLLSPPTFSTTSSHAEEQPSPSGQQGSPPSPSPSDIPSQGPSDRQSLSLPDHPPAYQNVDDRRPIPPPSPPPRSPRPLPPVPSKPPTMINQGNGFNHHQPPSDQSPNPDPIAPHSREVSGSSSHAHQEPHSASPTSVLPFARPYSTPTAGTPPIVPQGRFHPPSSSTTRYDRTSTASLPPASQTPFYTLPAVRSTPEGVVDTAPASESSSAPWTQDPAIHQPSISSQQEQLFSSAASTMSYAPPPPPYTPSLGAPLMGRSASEYSPAPLAERVLSPPPSNPSRHIPPPAPPTILAPPPSGNQRSSAPHEPFLAHAPPPPDSWIAVETMPREYTLVVRLPGFGRDGITLATRRRRILHLVADSWEPGGGHFERRISFGYDADLAQVRAEFDGELLRVIIPRRTPAITWYGEARE